MARPTEEVIAVKKITCYAPRPQERVHVAGWGDSQGSTRVGHQVEVGGGSVGNIAFIVVSAGKTGEAGEARLDNFSGLWGTGAVPDGCHWPWGDASRYMVARV